MSNYSINNWIVPETTKLVDLKNNSQELTNKEIAKILNECFNNNRTAEAVARKYEQLSKNYYTTEMDRIIIKHVKLFPTNLQFAFNKAANELNVKFKGQFTKELKASNISGRYYSVIKQKYEIITTGSSEGFSINVKNSYSLKHPNKSNAKPRQHLKPVLWLMKQILELSDKDRKELITFLTNVQ